MSTYGDFIQRGGAIRLEDASENTLVVMDSSSGNVGIGTSNPETGVLLDVSGVIRGTEIQSERIEIKDETDSSVYTLFRSIGVEEPQVSMIAFTTVGSHSITFTKSGEYDILIVAGGGSGGRDVLSIVPGGGGGAGGLVLLENQFIEAGTYPVVVGNGGATGSKVRNNGGNSSFSTNEAIGGGAGGYPTVDKNGQDGGSGGGGAGSTSPGNGTEGQGFAGGRGINTIQRAGGGGGGAGGVGGNNASSPLNGRDVSDIFGTQYGIDGVFARGGRGGTGDNNQPTPAPPNSGNGGSGGVGSSNNIASTSGASGIVLIKPKNALLNSDVSASNAIVDTNPIPVGSLLAVQAKHNNATLPINVGIGTDTPSTSLHIKNTSSNTGGTDSIVNASSEAIMRLDGSSNTMLVGQTTDTIQLNAFSSSDFSTHKDIVLNAGGGNVGINTTTPQAKLDVRGGDVFVDKQAMKNVDTDIVYAKGAYVDASAGEKFLPTYWSKAVVLPNNDIVKIGGKDNNVSTKVLNEVYRSCDGGCTWFQISTFPQAIHGMAICINSKGTIIVSGGTTDYGGYSNVLNTVWISKDGGYSWSIQTDNAEWSARRLHGMVCLPDDTLVLMGGFGNSHDIWKSTDDGKTWTLVLSSPPWKNRYTYFTTFQHNGTIVVTLASSGIQDTWISNDGGYTWIVQNIISPSSDYASAQENNIVMAKNGILYWVVYDDDEKVYRSLDYGKTWNIVSDITGQLKYSYVQNSSIVEWKNSLVIMGGYAAGSINTVFRSDDEGRSWYELTANAIRNGDPIGFVSQCTHVNSHGLVVVASNNRSPYNHTYHSTDNGSTWSTVSTSNGIGVGGGATVLLSDDSIVVIGGGLNSATMTDKVYRSTDNGRTFTEISTYPLEISLGTAVVLQNDTILHIGGYIYGSPNTWTNKVYRSVDKGVTWTQLPDFPGATFGNMNAVLTKNGNIIVRDTRNLKIYMSSDDGNSWTMIYDVATADDSIGFQLRQTYTSFTITHNDVMVSLGGNTNDNVVASYDGGYSWVVVAENTGIILYTNTVVNPFFNELLVIGGYDGTSYINTVTKIPLQSIEDFRTTGITHLAHDLNAGTLRESGVKLEDKYLKKQGTNVVNGEMILKGGNVRLERPVDPLPMSEPELRYPPAAGTINADYISSNRQFTSITISNKAYGNGLYEAFTNGIPTNYTGASGTYQAAPSQAFNYNVDLNDSQNGEGENRNEFSTTTGLSTASSLTTTNSNLSSDYNGVHLQIRFPKPLKLTKYRVQASKHTNARDPKNWVIVGSHDGEYWELLQTITDADVASASEAYITQSSNGGTFTLTNTTYYRYYRMVVSSVNTRGTPPNPPNLTLNIRELELFGHSDTLGLQYPPSALTDNTTTITGERYGNGVYVASTNSFRNEQFAQWKAFDYTNEDSVNDPSPGHYVSKSSSINTTTGIPTVTFNDGSTDISGISLIIQLPEQTYIQNYVMWNYIDQKKNYPKDWKIYGSNNNTTWTEIGSVTNHPDTANVYKAYSVSSPDYYQYYYQYYAFVITSVTVNDTGESYIRVGDIQLFGLPTLDKLYRFPPRALTDNLDTIEGEAYGNGVYEVEASSELVYRGTTYSGYRAFNTNYSDSIPFINTGYSSGVSTNSYFGGFIGEYIKIKLPNPVYLTNYRFLTRNSDARGDPVSWVFVGSNDNIKWDIVHSYERSNTAIGRITYSDMYYISSAKSYLYYAMVVSRIFDTGTNNYLTIAELELYGTPLESALIQSDANSQTLQLAPTASGKVVIGNAGVTNTANEPVLEVNGNVGIGTTTPTEKLDVNGNINFTGTLYQNGEVFSSGINQSQLDEKLDLSGGTLSGSLKTEQDFTAEGKCIVGTDGDNYNNELRTLSFVRGMDRPLLTGDRHHYIASSTGGSTISDQNYLAFYIDDGTTSNGTSHNMVMSVQKDGVGIGTNDPSAKLDVSGGAIFTDNVIMEGSTTSNYIRARLANTNDYTHLTYYGVRFYRVSSYLWPSTDDTHFLYVGNTSLRWNEIIYWTSSNHRFFTDQTERMRLTSSGRLGIGTTSPQTTTEIQGGLGLTSWANPSFTASGTAGLWMGYSAPNCVIYGYNYNSSNAGAIDITLQVPGGNVGIGTTNPQGVLDVNIGKPSAETAYGYIRATKPTGGYGGLVVSHSTTYGTPAYRTASSNLFECIAEGQTKFVVEKGPYFNVGIGTTTPRAKLESVFSSSYVVSTSCASYQTVMLLKDGTVKAVGSNSMGISTTRLAQYLGVGPGSGAIAVSCGSINTAVLFSDGTVKETQFYSTEPRTRLEQVDGIGSGSGAIAVSRGASHTAVLFSDGTVKTFGGNNSYGELGRTATPLERITPGEVDDIGSGSGAIAVSCGNYHTAVLFSDGTVKTFGSDDNGQLGRGGTSTTPVQVSSIGSGSGAIAVSCGDNHTAVLFSDGTVKTFGKNNSGQLGRVGISPNQNIFPGQVTGIGSGSGAIAVSCGGSHTAVLFSNGTVKTFGNNTFGQLGRTGTSLERITPGEVSGIGSGSGAIAIECGDYHTVVLFNNGTVKTFGWNSDGQLGDGSKTDRTTPVLVSDTVYSGTATFSSQFTDNVNSVGILPYAVNGVYNNLVGRGNSLICFTDTNFDRGYYATSAAKLVIAPHQNSTNGVVITGGGFVGISTVPNFPLEVVGTSSGAIVGGRVFDGAGNRLYNGGTTISIRTQFGVYSTEFIATSDRRIKTNIQDLEDNECLDIVRQLKPVKYEYIDKINKGNATVYGFIAQDVRETLPYATSIVKDFIPDYYDDVDISGVSYDASFIQIPLSETKQYDVSVNQLIRLEIGYTMSETNDISDIQYTIKETKVLEFSNNCITIENTVLNTENTENNDTSGNSTHSNHFKITSIFLYGKKVDDFHTVDKDKIWTVAMSGLQEVDRQQQLDKIDIQTIKEKTNPTVYIDTSNHQLDISTNLGMIVSSTGHIPEISLDNACPYIKLSSEPNDKRVFGVLNNGIGKKYGVNSLGEGGIWVSDMNGVIENGDYITSSIIPGYGQRQDDDVLHNYTVAKITMDCDFTQPLKAKQVAKKEVYEYEEEEDMRDASGELVYETVNVLDESGNQVMETVHQVDASGEPVFETVYVTDESGNQVMETVPVVDASGEPVFETVYVTDESGNQVMETVPVVDASGNPVFETVYVTDESGNQVMETVPVIDASGEPVFETVYVTDESGNQVMETVPVVDASGELVVDESGNFVTEDISKSTQVAVMEDVSKTKQVPVMEDISKSTQVAVMEDVSKTKQVPVMVEQVKTEERVKRVMVTKTDEREVLDDNGKTVWVVEEDASGNSVMVPAYQMRYLLIDGTEISKEEYDEMSGIKYRAAFVGCTYHCG